MPARPEDRRHRRVPGVQPGLVVERAVEADEGRSRARGRAGAEEVQRRGVSGRAVGVQGRPDRGGALSGEVAAARGLEGDAVQPRVRRHLQRRSAGVGAPLRMAPARVLPQMNIVKAHAYGNDFLLVEEQAVPKSPDRAELTRALCERHRGVGADGVIFYSDGPRGASMRLLNADGSPSEISGNGVRCLAAWLARTRTLRPGSSLEITTDAGVKTLELLAVEGRRLTFRAAMGQPQNIERRMIDVDGEAVDTIILRVGNPQCVVLGEVTEDRLYRIGSRLAVHRTFPEGTNVELATVERPDRVRILIWERGVGPTEASGTGACAAAVAAIAYGGGARDVEVVSPGGAQRVAWTEAGLSLTGWAEIVLEGRWLSALAAGRTLP